MSNLLVFQKESGIGPKLEGDGEGVSVRVRWTRNQICLTHIDTVSEVEQQGRSGAGQCRKGSQFMSLSISRAE